MVLDCMRWELLNKPFVPFLSYSLLNPVFVGFHSHLDVLLIDEMLIGVLFNDSLLFWHGKLL